MGNSSGRLEIQTGILKALWSIAVQLVGRACSGDPFGPRILSEIISVGQEFGRKLHEEFGGDIRNLLASSIVPSEIWPGVLRIS